MEELVFKYLEVRPNIDYPICAMTRGKDGSLILVRDGLNRWVLGLKNNFPDGMAKMVGGGIQEGEGPAEAAIREIKEETGAEIEADRLTPLIHAEIFDSPTAETPAFTTFVFYASIHRHLTADDDVSGFAYFSDHDLARMVGRMGNLPAHDPINTDSPATWHDWGLVWAPIHAAAIERVKELGI